MLKKLLCSLIGVVMLLSISACGGNSDDSEKSLSEKKAQAESKEITTTTAPVTTKTTTTTAAPKKLSEDYVLLAEGGTGEDYYELVATEDEDYNGTEIKIGVIKNNKWSVQLSSNSPFIGEDGLLTLDGSHYVTESGSIYDNPDRFRYIGKGCFYYDMKIINGNNGKSFISTGLGKEYEPHVVMEGCNPRSVPSVTSDRDETIINDEGLFLLSSMYEGKIKVLNANTMTISDTGFTFGDFCDWHVYPYNEGLFCIMSTNKDNSDINGFYNVKGEKVVDLSKYSLAKDISGGLVEQSVVFNEGTCEIIITNDQGDDYKVKMGKDGTVIDSIKWNN